MSNNMKGDLVLEDISTGQTFLLESGGTSYYCGRGKNSQIMSQSVLVSREHCVFMRSSRGLSVIDWGSANGIYINGRPQQAKVMIELQINDLIGLGCPDTKPYVPQNPANGEEGANRVQVKTIYRLKLPESADPVDVKPVPADPGATTSADNKRRHSRDSSESRLPEKKLKTEEAASIPVVIDIADSDDEAPVISNGWSRPSASTDPFAGANLSVIKKYEPPYDSSVSHEYDASAEQLNGNNSSVADVEPRGDSNIERRKSQDEVKSHCGDRSTNTKADEGSGVGTKKPASSRDTQSRGDDSRRTKAKSFPIRINHLGQLTRVSEEDDSPVVSEKLDSPAVSKKIDSPVGSKKIDSPVGSKKFDSPVVSEKLDSPVVLENLDSPVVSEKLDSAVVSEKLDSPVVSKKLDSSAVSEKLNSPAVSKKTDSSVVSKKIDSPVVSKKIDCPVVSEKLDSGVCSKKLDSRVISKKPDSRVEHPNTAASSVEPSISNERAAPARRPSEDSSCDEIDELRRAGLLDLSDESSHSSWENVEDFSIPGYNADENEPNDAILNIELPDKSKNDPPNSDYVPVEQEIKYEPELQIMDIDESIYTDMSNLSQSLTPMKVKRVVKNEPITEYSQYDVVALSDDEDNVFPASQLFGDEEDGEAEQKVKVENELSDDNDEFEKEMFDRRESYQPDLVTIPDSDDEDNPWYDRLIRAELNVSRDSVIKAVPPISSTEEEAPMSPIEEDAPMSPIEDDVPESPTEKDAPVSPIEEDSSGSPTENNAPTSPIDKIALESPIDKIALETPIDKIALETPIDKIALESPTDKITLESPIENAVQKSRVANGVPESPAEKEARDSLDRTVPEDLFAEFAGEIDDACFPTEKNKTEDSVADKKKSKDSKKRAKKLEKEKKPTEEHAKRKDHSHRRSSRDDSTSAKSESADGKANRKKRSHHAKRDSTDRAADPEEAKTSSHKSKRPKQDDERRRHSSESRAAVVTDSVNDKRSSTEEKTVDRTETPVRSISDKVAVVLLEKVDYPRRSVQLVEAPAMGNNQRRGVSCNIKKIDKSTNNSDVQAASTSGVPSHVTKDNASSTRKEHRLSTKERKELQYNQKIEVKRYLTDKKHRLMKHKWADGILPPRKPVPGARLTRAQIDEIKHDRKEKLKEIADKKKEQAETNELPAKRIAKAKAKVTQRSRNDFLVTELADRCAKESASAERTSLDNKDKGCAKETANVERTSLENREKGCVKETANVERTSVDNKHKVGPELVTVTIGTRSGCDIEPTNIVRTSVDYRDKGSEAKKGKDKPSNFRKEDTANGDSPSVAGIHFYRESNASGSDVPSARFEREFTANGQVPAADSAKSTKAKKGKDTSSNFRKEVTANGDSPSVAGINFYRENNASSSDVPSARFEREFTANGQVPAADPAKSTKAKKGKDTSPNFRKEDTANGELSFTTGINFYRENNATDSETVNGEAPPADLTKSPKGKKRRGKSLDSGKENAEIDYRLDDYAGDTVMDDANTIKISSPGVRSHLTRDPRRSAPIDNRNFDRSKIQANAQRPATMQNGTSRVLEESKNVDGQQVNNNVLYEKEPTIASRDPRIQSGKPGKLKSLLKKNGRWKAGTPRVVKRVSFDDLNTKIQFFEINPGNTLKKCDFKDAPSTIKNQSRHNDNVGTTGPKLEEFLLRIFEWNPVWLQEQKQVRKPPPVVNEKTLVQMIPKYDSYDAYYEIAEPLLALELWHGISKDYDNGEVIQKSTMKYSIVNNSVTRTIVPSTDLHVTTLMIEVIVNRRQWQIQSYPVFGDLIFFEYVSNIRAKEGGFQRWKVFGYVTKFHPAELTPFTQFNHDLLNYVQDPYKLLTYTVMTKPLNPCEMQTNKVSRLGTISYLRSNIRMIQALQYLPNSTLLNMVLHPKIEDYKLPTVADNLESYPLVTKDNLNAKQLEAVAKVTEAVEQKLPKICLIKGPPGTGKSKVIVNLITQIHYGRANNRKKPVRILVCAPSNAAIDEIVLRLLEIRKTFPKGKRFNMVRIGREQTMHPMVKEVSLTELAKKNVKSMTDSYMSPDFSAESIEEEKHFLEARKNSWELELACSRSLTATQIKHLRRKIEDIKAKYNLLVNRQSAASLDPKESAKLLRASENSLLSGADVIACTLTSCYTNTMESIFVGSDASISVCIVDEATQSMEAETLVPLMLGVKTLVLVGDNNQLPATVLSQKAKQLGLDQSLFGRIQTCFDGQEDSPIIQLDTQYRMSYPVAFWPNRYFYDGSLRNSANLRNLPFNFYKVINLDSTQDIDKFCNTNEANFVANLVYTIMARSNLDDTFPQVRIGIITPYNNQKTLVTKKIKERIAMLTEKTKKKFSHEVNTVDSFQGQERDIIIMSCVRSNGIGFLSDRQRLCVALTRAKHTLILCGNFTAFQRHPMWNALLSDARTRGVYLNMRSSAEVNEITRHIIR